MKFAISLFIFWGLMRYLLALMCFLKAFAGSEDSLHLVLKVETINKLSFSEVSPSVFADQFSRDFVYGESNSGSYGLITNDIKQKKITAQLDQLFPDGIELKLTLGAEDTWKSYPSQTLLDAKAQTIVEKIAGGSSVSNLSVIYEIKAPRLTKKTSSPYMRVITYTLMDD